MKYTSSQIKIDVREFGFCNADPEWTGCGAISVTGVCVSCVEQQASNTRGADKIPVLHVTDCPLRAPVICVARWNQALSYSNCITAALYYHIQASFPWEINIITSCVFMTSCSSCPALYCTLINTNAIALVFSGGQTSPILQYPVS
jgi:hypothetical protein